MLISAFFVGFSDLFFYWWCFVTLSFDDLALMLELTFLVFA